MTQEIEIEFKTLLNAEDFKKLLTILPFPENAVTQTNHYFDTKDMSLKDHSSALRIREKKTTYTLTLKQPHEKGTLETHDSLTYKEYMSWVEGKPISKPYNAKQLEQINVSMESLTYYGSLQTDRYAFNKDGFEIVLDHSHYLGRHDFELELEAKDFDSGLNAFEKLLAQHHIEKLKPITKIERFFRALDEDMV